MPLLLIDATALWSDELYSVGKSFQPSFMQPAGDAAGGHPSSGLLRPALALGASGRSKPDGLRLLSWLAYLAGGLVMVRQAMALGPVDARVKVAAVAALLAFCSPYPIRFAIEGKSYAVLVLLVALAWWWRRSGHPIAYGVVAGLAGLTHFYGLFLVLAAAAWDGWRRRWSFSAAALIGALPALAWMAYAADYLFSSRAASWIGVPDYALFEETLARGLGLWPLPKLALMLLLLVVFGAGEGCAGGLGLSVVCSDRSGLIPSLLMVVGVVAVSFVKPMAFSRYFVVLLPALVPVLAVQIGALELNRFGRGCGLVVLALMLASWWGPGFSELDAGVGGVRQDQFRLISQRTSGLGGALQPRQRLFNLSDRMEVAMGRIPSPSIWGDAEGDLKQRLPPVAFGALAGQQWTSTGHGAQAQTPAITSCAGWLPV